VNNLTPHSEGSKVRLQTLTKCPYRHIKRCVIHIDGECLKITRVFANIGILHCVNCKVTHKFMIFKIKLSG